MTEDPHLYISDEQLQKLHEVFAQFDENHDGLITRDELAGLLRALGQPADPASVTEVMSYADADHDGVLDLGEFISWAVRWMRQPLDEKKLRATFDSFDEDNNGYLSADELYGAMNALGLQCTRADAEAKLREADIDGDGVVNFDEFARAVAASQR